MHAAAIGGFKAEVVLDGAIGGTLGVISDDAVAIANGCGQIFEAALQRGPEELGACGADGLGEPCVESARRSGGLGFGAGAGVGGGGELAGGVGSGLSQGGCGVPLVSDGCGGQEKADGGSLGVGQGHELGDEEGDVVAEELFVCGLTFLHGADPVTSDLFENLPVTVGIRHGKFLG